MTVMWFLLFVSLSIWMGALAFMSFIAAPAIFRALPRREAGDLVSAIFPGSYRLAYICGSVSVVSAVWLARQVDPAQANLTASAILVMLMLILMGVAGLVLRPRAHRLREEARASEGTPGGSVIHARFDRVHRQAVWLNMAVMILGLAVFLLLARSTRPPGLEFVVGPGPGI